MDITTSLRETQCNVNEICVLRFAYFAKMSHSDWMNNDDSISIGEVVRRLRLEKGLTQGRLADQIDGYDAGNLSRFERGKQEITETKLSAIAQALGYSIATLYGMAELGDIVLEDKTKPVLPDDNIYRFPPSVSPGPDIAGRVPLISWVQAGEWTAIVDNFEPGDAEEWQETTAKVGPHAFALRVHGDSMVNPLGFPSIPEGSIVIVDPDGHAESGKIVVARLEDSVEATLKKLVIDGPHRYLKPLNPDYRPIQITGKCTIVGVVRQVISDL